MKIDRASWEQWLKSMGLEKDLIEKIFQSSERQGGSLPEAVAQAKAVPEEALIDFLSDATGVPPFIFRRSGDPELVGMFPQNLSHNTELFPLPELASW